MKILLKHWKHKSTKPHLQQAVLQSKISINMEKATMIIRERAVKKQPKQLTHSNANSNMETMTKNDGSLLHKEQHQH